MQDSRLALSAKTALYGVIGNPVEHSLSPLLHNAVIQKLRMNAVYLAFRVEADSLGLAIEGVRSLGIRGVNITIPHKEAAFNLVDEVPQDTDRCIGAINTVLNKNGKLYGYNTDGPGFIRAIEEELAFHPKGKVVLVLGAGGASRGVLFSLAGAEVDKILIYNRTSERAEGLKSYLLTHFPEAEIEVLASLDAVEHERIDLVVNASSCGMNKEDLAPLDLKLLKGKASVYDLIYTPSETPLLKMAKTLGLPNANGLGMLANQAALSFELWTGQKEGVRDQMLEVLKQCP